MTEFFAHILLFLGGRSPIWLGGMRWSYCSHQSHRVGVRCRKWTVYDGYCAYHNATCWGTCDKTKETA